MATPFIKPVILNLTMERGAAGSLDIPAKDAAGANVDLTGFVFNLHDVLPNGHTPDGAVFNKISANDTANFTVVGALGKATISWTSVVSTSIVNDRQTQQGSYELFASNDAFATYQKMGRGQILLSSVITSAP